MVAVPGTIPVMTPVLLLIAATPGVLLVQKPEGDAWVIVAGIEVHTTVGPTIAAGSGCTVIVLAAMHPSGSM